MTAMGRTEYVIKLTFKRPPAGCHTGGRLEYFFGSLSAIYDMFTPEQIGCKVQNLWSFNIDYDKPYENRICTISKEVIIRKAQRKR
jgi:hypothetical protein